MKPAFYSANEKAAWPTNDKAAFYSANKKAAFSSANEKAAFNSRGRAQFSQWKACIELTNEKPALN